ncbi:MAG: HDOD domain-containing protein [Gammaproteobacteria bacterium]|nr:HDOD domain-containing protein [Gammaproteobacteria bacterium]
MPMGHSKDTPVNQPILSDAMVARQPIYNKQMGVYAYELLFRGNGYGMEDVGSDTATAQVILNAFMNMGLKNLVGDRLASINLTERMLPEAINLPLPPKQVILEIPCDIEINREVIDVCRNLRKKGFTLALDNFNGREDLKDLLPNISLIKVCAEGLSDSYLRTFVAKFRKYNHIKLLALRVESLEQYKLYCDVGFDYCQGFLLSKPRVYATKEMPGNKLTVMNLLAVLYNPDSELIDIERIISHDVAMSFKLMRLMNSAFFGLPSPIDSVSQAVALLGKNPLRSWTSLMALSSMNDCPKVMIELALMRAKMCEGLAREAQLKPYDSYFTAGLFSALDMLMEYPLERLLTQLPLNDAIKQAILQHEGSMGEALCCVLAYEKSDWDGLHFAGLAPGDIMVANMEAFEWTQGMTNML